MTARVVAAGRAVGVAGRRDHHVGALLPVPDRLAVRALRHAGGGRGRRASGPGAHAGLRMAAVDAAVEESLRASGAATLVVVGAGYDTRAFRLEALRGRRVVEVDHPATQGAKLRRLPPVREALAELVLAGADLATDHLGRVLDEAGHDPTAPTVWLWEAVVPYLPEPAVDRTLAALRDRSAPGSRLVVTTVTPPLLDPPGLGRALRPVVDAGMRLLGEPVLLAESDDDVADRLGRHGFRALRSTGPRRWAADAGVQVVGPVIDERLHVAEHAS